MRTLGKKNFSYLRIKGRCDTGMARTSRYSLSILFAESFRFFIQHKVPVAEGPHFVNFVDWEHSIWLHAAGRHAMWRIAWHFWRVSGAGCLMWWGGLQDSDFGGWKTAKSLIKRYNWHEFITSMIWVSNLHWKVHFSQCAVKIWTKKHLPKRSPSKNPLRVRDFDMAHPNYWIKHHMSSTEVTLLSELGKTGKPFFWVSPWHVPETPKKVRSTKRFI